MVEAGDWGGDGPTTVGDRNEFIAFICGIAAGKVHQPVSCVIKPSLVQFLLIIRRDPLIRHDRGGERECYGFWQGQGPGQG